MAAAMFQGASFGRSPESFWKNTNHGNLLSMVGPDPADSIAALVPDQTNRLATSTDNTERLTITNKANQNRDGPAGASWRSVDVE